MKKKKKKKRRRRKERLKKRTVRKIQCTVRENGGVHLLDIKPMYYLFISSSKIQLVFVEFFQFRVIFDS
jgi:hypothetical protein